MEREPPTQASAPAGAVFLSYASQDAEAAKRICEALRAASIEVWFDQSELRGGDAWDQKIRRELHDCVLFMPVISAHTAARHEGYFRLEWDLADQRTHMIARNRAFIVPVCVDATPETTADTPDSFRRVQWTRLPGGETPSAFVERIQRLLTGEVASPSDRVRSSATAIAKESSVPGRPNRLRTDIVFGGIAIAALLATGYFALDRMPWAKPHAQNGASIAVLPLANESGDASQQYFSDGISEDLITALGQFHGLRVIGRSSSFQFRDSKEDSRSIGAKLGVAHLLEGSVRKAGDMIRVSAQLIDTTDGSMQWSERYDRPAKDLFTLQDEITSAVAGALKAHLVPSANTVEQNDRPPSGNLAAYNAVLEGRFYYVRDNEADSRKAIERFTLATQLDPRYALAWTWVSRAWGGLAANDLDNEAQREGFAKARAAASTALTLAPDLPSAHIAMGWVLLYGDFDWHGAETAFRDARRLAPADNDAMANLGVALAALGRVDEAIELIQQAIVGDPLRTTRQFQLAGYLVARNRLDEAETALRKAIELQPNAEQYHATLSSIEILRGDAQAALAAAEREPPSSYRDAAVAMALQIGSDGAAANAAVQSLAEKEGTTFPYAVAEVYALRKEPDKVFAWLERAWSARDTGIAELLYDPFILRYKDDRRFTEFCRKVGLPAPGDAR